MCATRFCSPGISPTRSCDSNSDTETLGVVSSSPYLRFESSELDMNGVRSGGAGRQSLSRRDHDCGQPACPQEIHVRGILMTNSDRDCGRWQEGIASKSACPFLLTGQVAFNSATVQT